MRTAAALLFMLFVGLTMLEGCATSIRDATDITCSFLNSTGCDVSCRTNFDCKSSVGHCVNRRENVVLPEGINPAYIIQTCKCENNICVGTSTGMAAI